MSRLVEKIGNFAGLIARGGLPDYEGERIRGLEAERDRLRAVAEAAKQEAAAFGYASEEMERALAALESER